MKKNQILVLLFCLVGNVFPILAGVISIGALVWNVAPYFIFGLLFFIKKNNIAFFSCVVLMLIVDSLLYITMIFDSHSSYLLALSLISTLKILLSLPVFMLFYFFTKYGVGRT